MHDAMQVYWSRFANKPQWSMWVFFAAAARDGHRPRRHHVRRHRPQPPPGHRDLQRLASSRRARRAIPPGRLGQRMRFWTAATRWGTPSTSRTRGRSRLGHAVDSAGRRARGAQLHELSVQRRRRPDGVLRRLRLPLQRQRAAVHAPRAGAVRPDGQRRLVRPSRLRASANVPPSLGLQVRAARQPPKAEFEFLEPMVLELKLTNVSSEPQLVERRAACRRRPHDGDRQEGRAPARQWLPLRALLPRGSAGGARARPVRATSRCSSAPVATAGTWPSPATTRPGRPAPGRRGRRLGPAAGCGSPRRAASTSSTWPRTSSATTSAACWRSTAASARRGQRELREVAAKLPDRPVAEHAQMALANPARRQAPRAERQRRGNAAIPCRAGGLVVKAEPEEARKQLDPALTTGLAVGRDAWAHRLPGLCRRILRLARGERRRSGRGQAPERVALDPEGAQGRGLGSSRRSSSRDGPRGGRRAPRGEGGAWGVPRIASSSGSRRSRPPWYRRHEPRATRQGGSGRCRSQANGRTDSSINTISISEGGTSRRARNQ